MGDGKIDSRVQDFYLQPGQTVLYSKFGIGVTDLLVQGEQHCLIKEEDCIGILPRSGATADDIPQLQPNGDRVLLKASVATGPHSFKICACGFKREIFQTLLLQL